MHKVYKRGDKREDGMVFWQYKRSRKKSEYWITEEKYEERKSKIRRQQKAINKKRKILKCGDVRKDGMIFWSYNRGVPNGEWWMSREKFNAFKKAHNERVSANRRKRKVKDALYNITNVIRDNVRYAIRKKGYTKNTKTAKILGCTYEKFKKHIESQFTDGMSWKNQGDWHLDHRLPVSAARNKDEIIKLNHYTNFQPLWAKDNLAKSDKYDPKELEDYLLS